MTGWSEDRWSEVVTPEEFESRPTAASLMPLSFGSEKALTYLHGRCLTCGRRIPDADMRAIVTPLYRETFRTRTLAGYRIEARGHCGSLTEFHYALSRDLRRLYGLEEDKAGGVTNVYEYLPQTRWQRLRSWVRGLLGMA